MPRSAKLREDQQEEVQQPEEGLGVFHPFAEQLAEFELDAQQAQNDAPPALEVAQQNNGAIDGLVAIIAAEPAQAAQAALGMGGHVQQPGQGPGQ